MTLAFGDVGDRTQDHTTSQIGLIGEFDLSQSRYASDSPDDKSPSDINFSNTCFVPEAMPN